MYTTMMRFTYLHAYLLTYSMPEYHNQIAKSRAVARKPRDAA